MSEVAEKPTAREKVERLERLLEIAPQVDCPVRHHFAPGVYAREMTIPAGVVATGAVHKTEHLTIISKGHCHLMTDEGVKEFRAPATVLSRPGIKRAITTMEETVLTTIHATTTTDLEALVSELTESTSAELLGGPSNRQLLRQQWPELEKAP